MSKIEFHDHGECVDRALEMFEAQTPTLRTAPRPFADFPIPSGVAFRRDPAVEEALAREPWGGSADWTGAVYLDVVEGGRET
jgi:hypothetical protein